MSTIEPQVVTMDDILVLMAESSIMTSKCILYYSLIVYAVIILLFIVIYVVDLHTYTPLAKKFRDFYGSLPGYAVVISTLAIMPTVLAFLVVKKRNAPYITKKMHIKGCFDEK